MSTLAANDSLQVEVQRYQTIYGRAVPPGHQPPGVIRVDGDAYDRIFADVHERSDVEDDAAAAGFVDADKLNQLIAMGFAEDRAREALVSSGGDVQTALVILTED